MVVPGIYYDFLNTDNPLSTGGNSDSQFFK